MDRISEIERRLNEVEQHIHRIERLSCPCCGKPIIGDDSSPGRIRDKSEFNPVCGVCHDETWNNVATIIKILEAKKIITNKEYDQFKDKINTLE